MDGQESPRLLAGPAMDRLPWCVPWNTTWCPYLTDSRSRLMGLQRAMLSFVNLEWSAIWLRLGPRDSAGGVRLPLLLGIASHAPWGRFVCSCSSGSRRVRTSPLSRERPARTKLAMPHAVTCAAGGHRAAVSLQLLHRYDCNCGDTKFRMFVGRQQNT